MTPILGKLLTERIVAMAGGADKIEAYGKAAMAGLAESDYQYAFAPEFHVPNAASRWIARPARA